MKYSESLGVRPWLVATLIVATSVFVNATTCRAQSEKWPAKADQKTAAAESTAAPAPPKADDKSTPAAAPAADKSTPAKTDASSTTATTGAAGAANPPAVTSAPPAAATPTDKKSESSALPAGKSAPSAATKAADATGVHPDENDWSPWLLCITLLALFIVPILIGNYLAGIWRMPDHAWKISLTLGVLAGSILICFFGQFKFGPDLAGGITLIYELQDAPVAAADQAGQPKGANPQGAPQQLKSGGKQFSMTTLIGALKKRLDPDGTKEISIREYGPAVEIIIPQVGQDEMDFVKQKITALGKLEFRITADPTIQKDKNKIELAKLASPNQKDVKQGDDVVAKWVPYDVKEFGPPDRQDGFVKRTAGDTPEILVLMDPMNVTGEYLVSAGKTIDEHGGPAVSFSFNTVGAQRFERLTSQNLPNPATPEKYRKLGILLDNKLVNAPNLHSTISSSGQISGGSMTDRDVELTIEVLNAGSLPAALNKTPISQEIISPTLGKQTIEQGKFAIGMSLVGVVIFMIIYYRFAGIIACLALTLNLLLVLALMVLIKAAFTLPGLAGLALTVGMSVDTNVLIYERIREELESGAALRMAIRNGFSRAMTAIIDTHLTTIISGIVLFYVGTDQVKGFAVTLILGLLCNLFTAYFCTRLMFDITERLGMIKQLKMMHIFSHPNFDFLRWRWIMLGASWSLIAIGMVAVYMRGTQLLDIDFTGGSSITFTLNDKDKMSLVDVRDALLKTELADKNLLVVELRDTVAGPTGTGYTIDTSEQSVDNVKKIVTDQFGAKLKRYSLETSDVKAVNTADFTGTEAKVRANAGPDYKGEEGMSHDALHDQIVATLNKQGHPNSQVTVNNPNYRTGSGLRYSDWTVQISGLDEPTTHAVLDQLAGDLKAQPLFPLASTIGGRVSGNMQVQAFLAVGISLVAMIIYLWLRFQKPTYGIAAGVALIHDVLMTVGMIALSYYIVNAVPGLALALKIDAFQINLTIVAALLTIIGYSVNDTVVTFDRLREIKGKTPLLTAKMVNDSVNQTLGRTILTVFTVFIVVVVLYFFGGAGLHSFAFAFLVGVVVGTYSSIYVASPVLLWLSGVSAASVPEAPAPTTTTRGMQPAR